MPDVVDDAYKKSKETKADFVEVENPEHAEVEYVDARLTTELKELKSEINLVYSKLIGNPYLAPNLIDDARSTLVRTVGVLMEYSVPLQHEGRKRTADDIIRESIAELGGLLGAKGAVAALRAKRSFQDAWEDLRDSEDFEIFQDPETEEYYFIDSETGEEYDCDELGNPLED